VIFRALVDGAADGQARCCLSELKRLGASSLKIKTIVNEITSFKHTYRLGFRR
jgi:hypothetical protein